MDRFGEKDISGCGIAGIMDRNGKRFPGTEIIASIASMRERSNGLGGGFAAYGIYPDFKEHWCFHMMFENKSAMVQTEEYLRDNYKILKDEIIPTKEDRKGSPQNRIDYLPEGILERDKERRASRSQSTTQAMRDAVAAQKQPGPSGSPVFGPLQRCSSVMCRTRHTALVAPCTDLKSGTPNSQSCSVATPKYRPLLWRYFLQPKKEKRDLHYDLTEEDFVAKTVFEINSQVEGAFAASSGRNMGVFKGVGYPEDIGRFYRLEEYEAYIWTAHGRFPTNTAAWWGGAHPFGLLDWSVVHNGEISSYGINKRFLQNYGYVCSFSTDTEVITYLFDLLVRKHKLTFETTSNILAAPFWDIIERESERRRETLQTLRIIYGSALINGPFSVIAANSKTMVGLNDRIKLRPLVAATSGNKLYIASEESAIREVCPSPEKVWMPRAGEPVIGRLDRNG